VETNNLIICHINADFDCLSSMLGAKKIYPDATIVFPSTVQKKVREFIETFNPFVFKKSSDINIKNISRLIIVDTRVASRLGPFKEIVTSGKVKIHIYDHHPVPHKEDSIKAELEIIEEVGATATIFTEIIKKQNIPITPMDATILCLGIYEETGSLRFPTTTERDLLAVAYLLRRGANLNIVAEYTKMELTHEDFVLLNELIASAKDIIHYGIKVKIVKASRRDYVTDAATLAHRIMDMEEIDGIVMLIETDGKVVIICRSKLPEFDVTQLLQEFNGGGHPFAGSATVKGVPLEIIEDKIIEIIKKSIKPQKLVKDIMTFPVITIDWQTTIKQAELMMTRYGVNVLPVLKEGIYYGLLSREVVEKAILHGFRKSKVYEFATTDAKTTTLETPLSEIEKVMVEHNQRFVPVLKDKKICGCITRTDLLRSLYEEILRRKKIKDAEVTERLSFGKNIENLIKERFPKSILKILKTAGEIAEELNYKVYIVGGSVRDLLRGEKNLDIDLVVEGDGIKFAKSFAEKFENLKVVIHKRFNTAKVIFNMQVIPNLPWEHFIVDIATARTEYYERPASLPKVETSSIKKDLYRRDFTINTLAVKLNPKEFGLLIDYFGAQRDIKEKVIRVLHNLSFVEDPTRAFRAIRFAERFKFHISKHTQKLIKFAVRLNLFEKLSGSRIYEEILLIFKETEPTNSIRLLSKYGLLKAIHPELKLTQWLEHTIHSIKETLTWYNFLFLEEKIQKEIIYIMGIAMSMNEKYRDSLIKRLSIPSYQADLIRKGVTHAHKLMAQLNTEEPLRIYRTLQSYEIEILLFTMALSNRNIQKAISRYLLELRHIKPSIGGKELIEMGLKPGPIFKKIFNTLLEEKLKGNLKSPMEEKKFVLKNFNYLLS